ncbi:hypothetical protein ShzoTeo12_10490 [Shinella zoogloeoides]|nr:hypothetical protein ShzoTeo12_10490 [Shinella zoogloeoides]
MSEKTYKIVQLQTENVKRLKAVSITPSGRIVEVTGKNGNGKSSVLDSIFYAMGGVKEIPNQPIRTGADKAKTEINLGSLTIRRTFTRQEDGSFSTTLIVESEEGARFTSPQNILNKLIGDLTFDPLEFTRKKPADQFELMKRFVPDFDFEAEEQVRKQAFERRTDVNRTVRDWKSQIAGITVPEGTPSAEIDISALTEELQKVGEFNADIETRRANRARVADQADQWEIEARNLDAKAAELRRQADEAEQQAAERRKQAEANRLRLKEAGDLPEQQSADAVRAKIDAANRTNADVRLLLRLNELLDAVRKAEAEADQLTKDIEESNKRKLRAIEKAALPVSGIGFGDGFITLNDVPFDQASTAEQIRAGCEISMAANPRLRVIMIREGSLLDEDSMQVVANLAEKHDYQVWIETVQSDSPGAVVIEDGLVKQPVALEAAE